MIAAQLDTVLAGSSDVYAVIENPADASQVWDTDAQAFAASSSVTAVNRAVAVTVDAWARARAAEPAGFPDGLIADCVLYIKAGENPAVGDELAGLGKTNYEAIAGDKDAVKAVVAALDEMIEDNMVEQKQFTKEALGAAPSALEGLYLNTAASAEVLLGMTETVEPEVGDPYRRLKGSALEEVPAASLTSEQVDILLSLPASLASRLPAGMFILGSVSDTSTSTSQFRGNNELSSINGIYSEQRCVLTFLSGPLQGLSNRITGYDGSNRRFAFEKPWILPPQNGNQFVIMGRIDG